MLGLFPVFPRLRAQDPNKDDAGVHAAPFLAPIGSEAGAVDTAAIDRLLRSTGQVERTQLHRLLGLLVARIRAQLANGLAEGLLPDPHAPPRDTNSKRFIAISSRILSRAAAADGRHAAQY